LVEHAANCDDGGGLHGSGDSIPEQRVPIEQLKDCLATSRDLVNRQVPEEELRRALALDPEQFELSFKLLFVHRHDSIKRPNAIGFSRGG
jgi:hypothetical protein